MASSGWVSTTGKVKKEKLVVESLRGSNLLEDFKPGHMELMSKSIVLPVVCEDYFFLLKR